MSDDSVQEYILSKCRRLIPYFDPRETFHAFCGARAKSDRGDWIIERSAQDGNFINVAGIDSPGLAGEYRLLCVNVFRVPPGAFTVNMASKHQPYTQFPLL